MNGYSLRTTALALAVLGATQGPAGAEDSAISTVEPDGWAAQHDWSLTGRFAERTPGSYVVVPAAEGLRAVPVANPDGVSPLALNRDLSIKGTYSAEKGQLTVEGYTVPGFEPPHSAPPGREPIRGQVADPSGLNPRRGLGPRLQQLEKSGAGYTTVYAVPRSSAEVDGSLRLGGDRFPASPSVAAAGHATAQSPPAPKPPETDAPSPPVRSYLEVLNAAIQPGAMSASFTPDDPSSPVNRAADKARNELTADYQRAVSRGDDTDRTRVVRQWALIRQEPKALYGESDNRYPPWTYPRVFEKSRSVVAIARPGGGRAICSGSLISDTLVLTAAHCFQEFEPEQLVILLGFAEMQEGQSPDPVEIPITALVVPTQERRQEMLVRAHEARFGSYPDDHRFRSEMLDFAIVRIGNPPGLAVPRLPTPLCLYDHDVDRDRSLYAIGYPKGEAEKVADNGRVYLPFGVNAWLLDKIQLEIEADFAMYDPEYRKQIVEDFRRSYKPAGPAGSTRFELRNAKYGEQPMVGIVADLFRGNSGSPVFERNRHCIAGMHIQGMPDTGTRLGATWLAHESMLPMPAILGALAATPETAALLQPGVLTVR